MKAFLVIFLSLSIYNANAQKDINFIKRVTSAKDSLICFQCENIKSKVVITMTKLIQDRNYMKIKQRLYSKNSGEKFLAAKSCDKLFILKKVSLSDAEKKQIEEIYKSKDTLYSYSNDTYVEAKPIREYISSEDDKLILNQTEKWLNDIVK